MKYLIDFTESSAEARSKEIAESHGSFGTITLYFFGFFEKHEDTDWCLIVPTGYEDELTAEEQAALKTKTYMADNDWFPPDILP